MFNLLFNAVKTIFGSEVADSLFFIVRPYWS